MSDFNTAPNVNVGDGTVAVTVTKYEDRNILEVESKQTIQLLSDILQELRFIREMIQEEL